MLEKLSHLEDIAKKRNIPILQKEKAIWLEQFILEHKPENILELGTAIGYSTIILGSQGAHVTTIDRNKKELDEAQEFCAYFNTTATFILNNALDAINKLEDPFDFIFLDFEKKHYAKVLERCLLLLSKTGYILADNTNHPHCTTFVQSVQNNPLCQILLAPDDMLLIRKV